MQYFSVIYEIETGSSFENSLFILKLFHRSYFQAQQDSKFVPCKRFDLGLYSVRLLKNLNISTNNSELENTTEQIASVNDQAAVEDEYDAKSSNSSESQVTMQNLRELSSERDLVEPEETAPTERAVSINCKHPDTTCVTVRCSLYGPIGKFSRTHVSFKMSADLGNLGEFPFHWPVPQLKSDHLHSDSYVN